MGGTLLKCAHAVCVGAAHERRGLPCQDSTASYRTEHACAVTLCDGAGSVPGSEHAASAAADAIAVFAAESFETLWSSSDMVVREALLQSALDAVRERFGDLRPACTALLAVMADDGRWMAAHLGDGVILALEDLLTGTVLSLPENGSSLSATYFLSGPDPLKHLRIYRGDAAQASYLLLSSDGASALLYDIAPITLAPVVFKMSRWLKEHDADAVSEAIGEDLRDVFRQRAYDDLSLAILCRVLREESPLAQTRNQFDEYEANDQI